MAKYLCVVENSNNYEGDVAITKHFLNGALASSLIFSVCSTEIPMRWILQVGMDYFMGYRNFRSVLLNQHKEALAREHPFFILRFRNCKITLFRMIRENREKWRSLL